MNRSADTMKRSDAIRHEIDETRHRMDQTIDALAGRLKGRHLVDEAIGYFRSQAGNEKAMHLKDSITRTTQSAVNNVVNSVKANPWPAVLIGAGVAWMVYSATRSESDSGDEDTGEPVPYDAASESGYQYSGGGYSTGETGPDIEPDISGAGYTAIDAPSGESGLGAKLNETKESMRDRAAEAKSRFQEKASQLRDRATQLSAQLQQRTREIYDQGRERVVTTVREHPLEVGLGVLALGVAVGLALPTPQKANEIVGPRVDRLRDRAKQAGRDLVNRGKSVAQAAAEAARNEARSQGLSPEAIRDKAGAVADRAGSAAMDSAQSGARNDSGSESISG